MYNYYIQPQLQTTFEFNPTLCYRKMIPSGQGHFTEQKTSPTSLDPRISGGFNSDSFLRFVDIYHVGAGNSIGLLDLPDAQSFYYDYHPYNNFIYPSANYNGYVRFFDELGNQTGAFANVPISFLKPSYRSSLKASLFPPYDNDDTNNIRASSIINNEAHHLAIEAGISGGGFNYLSNMYHFITKNSDINFMEYKIYGRYSDWNGPLNINQKILSSSIESISQVSGTISSVLN